MATVRAGTNGTSLQHTDCLFIGGNWVRAGSPSAFDVVNPATEETFLRVPQAQAADVNKAVAAARQAFDAGPWPRMSHLERSQYLRAMSRALGERNAEVSRLWSMEMGIVHSIAGAMVPALANVYETYAAMAESFDFEELHKPQGSGELGLLVREPVGVVGAIVPWNAPAMVIAYKLAPALLAGCTVILKVAPEAPAMAYVLGEVAASVGLPAGVLNCIVADREVSETVVRHPGVDKISFTGSTAAGRKIAAICGERIARCTLELGGKSAAVILDDYDVAAAAAAIAGPACLLTGQVCASLSRIIVSRHRHDALVEALAGEFSGVRVGDPFDATTQMGPLAMSRQRDRVEYFIGKAREEGATLAAGGGRPKGLSRGFYMEPTVFGNVNNHSTVAREEVFGPVLSVIAAADEAEAVDIANDTIYGLNASVFTNDPDRAYSTARRLRTGTVGHNSFRSDFSIAFGGFKQSGIGREGGREGLFPYLETKTVILDAGPSHRRDA